MQDPVGLAVAHRAQDDGLRLQRSGQDRLAILGEVMAAVTVYPTDPCSFCSRVKQLLDVRAIAFDEINLAKDPDGRAELLQRTGMMSFPQVIMGGEWGGGVR